MDFGDVPRTSDNMLESHRVALTACVAAMYSDSAVLKQTIVVSFVHGAAVDADNIAIVSLVHWPRLRQHKH